MAARWATGWDTDKNGAVTMSELREGLGQVLGPPPGAGGSPSPPAANAATRDVIVPVRKEGAE